MNTCARKNKFSMQWMTGTAMMIALIMVLANTPLGLIRLPFLTATTLHIPVIIATLVLGLEAGLITGFVFGLNSLISNLTGASFFAPFFINPLVSVLPRMLFPVCVHLIRKAIERIVGHYDCHRSVAYIGASALGTLAHTAMVMGMIYILYHARIADMVAAGANAPEVLAQRGVGIGVALLGMLNGVPEAIVATVIAPFISKALDGVLDEMNARR